MDLMGVEPMSKNITHIEVYTPLDFFDLRG